MKVVPDSTLDRIEAIVAEIELLDPKGELRQASDREALETVNRILRRRNVDTWQQIGDVAKKVINDVGQGNT